LDTGTGPSVKLASKTKPATEISWAVVLVLLERSFVKRVYPARYLWLGRILKVRNG
jgi:hypothetical protein